MRKLVRIFLRKARHVPLHHHPTIDSIHLQIVHKHDDVIAESQPEPEISGSLFFFHFFLNQDFDF